jgi:hypothetical protein
MEGWKQKSGWIQILTASCVPFTFPFLSQLSVCLIVSRVRAYLTTDQQHEIPCFLKRGPLPDWPVWTREQMISGGAAEREDRGEEAGREKPVGTQPPPLIIESKHPRVPSPHSTLIIESKHPRVPHHHSTHIIREWKSLSLSPRQGAPPKTMAFPFNKRTPKPSR